jgi:hypothetical protein
MRNLSIILIIKRDADRYRDISARKLFEKCRAFMSGPDVP